MQKITLVLLPGLDGTGELFEPLICHLPDWISPLIISYPRDKPCSYQELKTLVLKALPTEAEYVILGESFAGPLAVLISGAKPAGLKGIILCASFVKKPFRVIPSWFSLLSVSPVYLLWPATIRLRTIFVRGEYRLLVDMVLKAIRSVRPGVIAERVKAILTVNVEKELMQTDVPMLYLVGQKDYLIRKHNVAGIKKIKND
ncbi:MAG: alpha/beta fold hydrolase, partial [Acidiferrobacterales bacterium]